MMGIADAVVALRPGAAFVLRGLTYADLEWLDENQTKPTEQEVNDEIANLDAAAGAEATRQSGIETDTAYLGLVDKAKTASAAQIKTYIDSLFPSLSAGQRDFLKALVFISIMNPQLRG